MQSGTSKFSPALCAALLLVFIMSCGTRSRGQEVPAQKVLHNEDVVSLAKAGLSDAAIISVIRTSKTGFDLSPEGLVSLRRAGVSNAVIEAMLGMPTAGPTATGPAEAPLPRAFGYYVLEGNETRSLVDVKVVTRVGLRLSGGGGFAVDGLEGEPPLTIRTATPVFIVYQQTADVTGLHLSDLVYVSTMKAFEFNISGTQPFLFPSLYGRNYDDTVQVNVWRPKTDVPLRIEPVEAKPGMYRLIPSSPLKPGRYALYALEALNHEGMILGTGAIRPSEALYFGVSSTPSNSAAEPPRTQPVNPASAAPQPLPPVASSCSNYDVCIQSGTAALKSSQWSQALADFQKASNLEPSRPEALDGAGTALLRLGRYQEFGPMWDKALQFGGTLRVSGCHQRFGRCDLGVLQLSLSELSFVESKGQTLFAATPREVTSRSDAMVVTGIYYLMLGVGDKKYKIFYFPEGVVGCKEKAFDVRCAEPGKTQQRAFAEYVDRTILRIATGESTKKQ